MVSIIIPHFNRSELVRETVASVEAQTCGEWELILVDDGSSPAERKAISTLESTRIRIIDRVDGPKGPSRCRNLGAKTSCGEFLIFLDSDDLLAPECVARRLALSLEAPDADLWVFPVLEFTEMPGDSERPWGTMRPGADDARRFLQGDAPWHTSSPLWRKEAFLSIGGFNEAVFYGDDADLHLRAILSGLKIQQYPDEPTTAFVRRSNLSRITNSLDDFLLRSRRIRLTEGYRALASFPERRDLLPVWEGQFFVEAEFLLFNCENARESIDEILVEWESHYKPSPWRRSVVRTYLHFALATRRRAYLLLRIARRIAKPFLPTDFFT